MPWENLRDFSTITGLVILNSRWWFDWCLYDCKFRHAIAKGTISIKLHFIFLSLFDVNVLYISWARICFVNINYSDQSFTHHFKESLSNIQMINVYAISNFQYSSSYLINLWFSDKMLNKLHNIYRKWGKAVKVAFSHSQNGHFRCPKRKSETCSDIRSVTWLRGKKFAHFRPLESGFLAFSHFI